VILSVSHRTTLTYSEPIADTQMEMRLRPRDELGQRCISYHLDVQPHGPIRAYADPFGNQVEVYNHRPPHDRIVVDARSVVLTGPVPADGAAGLTASERYRLQRFDGPVSCPPGLRELARSVGYPVSPPPPSVELLTDLAGLVNRTFVYEPNVTRVDSTVADLFALGRGVCQDFAHAWIGLCRLLGLPARYVSGYIWNGDARQEQASHAWGEAFLPGQGWVAFDPTNYSADARGRVGEAHVRVAVGRDYRDVPPTRGVFRGAAAETLCVDVRVLETSGLSRLARV